MSRAVPLPPRWERLGEGTTLLAYLPWLAALVVLAVFPMFGPPVFFLRLIGNILLFVVLAQSWNIIGGYTGYVSFGHVTFFGIGAYVAALLFATWGWPPYAAILPGGLAAAVFAILIGYPTLRLRGPYFAIATLALSLVVQVAVSNLAFTGGGEGIVVRGGMPFGGFAREQAFYLCYLALAAITCGFVMWAERSKLGYGLCAIRDDQDVAQSVGVGATRLKLIAFAMSSFFAGTAGSIYAHQVAYVSAPDIFTLDVSIKSLIYAVIGGTSTVLGPVIGAVLMELLNIGLTTSVLGQIRIDHIVFGVLLAAVVLVAPRGIMGAFQSLAHRGGRR